MGSETPQTISHNRIKIKGKKHETSRTLNFINQFASGHQLVCQTQQSRKYNRKGRIRIQ